MTDSKKDTNKQDAPVEAPTELVNTDVAPDVAPVLSGETVDPNAIVVPDAVEPPSRPDLQMLGGDFKLAEGQNLYFFPDIQKSVAADSLADAQTQVQSELDAFNKQDKENN